MSVTTEPRPVEQIAQEIEAARLAREAATGRIKGNMTRQIKALEAELAQAQQAVAHAEPATPPAVKKTPSAKFDSPRLIEIIEKAGAPLTVAQVAEASGYEAGGSLTNRLVWLSRRDNLLRETEITVEGKKVRAFTWA